jgi:DNA end-binding protein Ku
VCELDGEEVPYADIAKGYELPDGDVVVLSDKDMERLPLSTSKAVEVLEFVPAEQVDPLLFGRAYYAQPDASAAKPYVLMRDTLANSDRVAVVKIALRTRETLAVLRPRGDVLVVQTLLWPEEVRDPATLAPHEGVTVRKQEVAMAGSYIDTLAGDFEPDRFTDDYRAAVDELVAAKTAGREVGGAPARETTTGGQIIDLVDALRASVRDAKAQRGTREQAGAGSAGKKQAARKQPASKASGGGQQAAKKAPEKKAPAKKAPAKRTSTKKASSKKTTVKKAPARKTTARKSA